MPELLDDGLPERMTRVRYDFSQWNDGKAWKFVKGEDYKCSTETFRANVKRWANENDLQVEVRPYPALDREGRPIPLTKTDPIALGVRFGASSEDRTRAGA